MLSNSAPSSPSKYVPSGKLILGCCLRLELKDFCGSLCKLLIRLHTMLTVMGGSSVLHEIVKIDDAADTLQILRKPIAGALSHLQLFRSH